jgi:hypothetical protein
MPQTGATHCGGTLTAPLPSGDPHVGYSGPGSRIARDLASVSYYGVKRVAATEKDLPMSEHLHLSTVKKMNRRIMPFIMLLYLIAYIDRDVTRHFEDDVGDVKNAGGDAVHLGGHRQIGIHL